MLKKIVALSYLLMVLYSTDSACNNKLPEFVILVTCYNNESYCERNLASIAWQKSSNPYRIIIVNDCSTDNTKELLENFVQTEELESKVTLIHNKERCYSLKNIYTTIHNYIEDHEIVVSVDGDDQLASNDVLLRLEKEYKKPYIHLTYGSSLPIGVGAKRKKPNNRKIPDLIIKAGLIRSSKGFKATHLKTFRAEIFKKIKEEDLMYRGEFLKAAGDVAMMYAMIDMLASPKPGEPLHVAFIPEILYLYNVGNPLNVHKTNRAIQDVMGKSIGKRKPYAPIDTKALKRTRLSNATA